MAPAYTRELAEQDFETYCEANEFDADVGAMSAEDKEAFLPMKARFIKASMAGRVAVNGQQLVYTVSKHSPAGFAGDTITIGRPTGAAMIAMDGYNEKQGIHKLQSFASAITGKEVKYFSKIDLSDWMFVRDIATLFLSA